jgi:TP53 regulating kinase-like protein
MEAVGEVLAACHHKDIVHGDLTTSNMMIDDETKKLTLIDFGLTTSSANPEDKAVDLYVLERAFQSTHPNSEPLFLAIMEAYKAKHPDAGPVVKKLEEVTARGRKRTMLG